MKENLLVNSAAFASDVKEVNGKLQFIMEGTVSILDTSAYFIRLLDIRRYWYEC